MDSPASHDVAPSVPVLPQANRTNRYEPPRIESLGTVEELTMGGAAPGMPDLSPVFGSVVFSDRRLKDHVTALAPGSVLEGVGSLTRPSYEPPRIESLGTVEELTMGVGTPFVDVGIGFGSSDRRLKQQVAPVDPRAVLRRVCG